MVINALVEGTIEKEPLLYDGSYMHAIERITPNRAGKNSFTYIATYKEGTKW